jgi:hypothetical protein
MLLYTFVAVITILLACRVRTAGRSEYDRAFSEADKGSGYSCKRVYYGLCTRRDAVNFVMVAAIFVVLTALAAFRIEVGNDYGAYGMPPARRRRTGRTRRRRRPASEGQ